MAIVSDRILSAATTSIVQQQKRVVIFDDVDSQGLFVTYRSQNNQRGRYPVQNKELLKGSVAAIGSRSR